MSGLPPIAQAISAANGAVVSTILLYPLSLTLTRVQTASRTSKGTKGYQTFITAIKTLYKQKGLTSFFSGLGPDVISTALSNFLYFYSFTFLRQFLIKRKKLSINNGTGKSNGGGGGGVGIKKLSGFEEILLGCLAGCIAKAVTSPLSNITVRAQTASDNLVKKQEITSSVVGGGGGGPEKNLKVGEDLEVGSRIVGVVKLEEESSDDEDSIFDSKFTTISIAKDIYNEKGWTGFWSGYKSAIVLTLNPAITQYLIDIFRRSIVPAGAQPTIAQTFFTSAIASSCSSAITYPLILAKTRLQFKSSGRRLYKSNLDVFVKTFKKQGLLGLYSGIEGQILKAFLSEGLKMLIKQRLELIIVLVYTSLQRKKLQRSAV